MHTIQAPALENPQPDGSESGHDSVWAHVACQPVLHRFDAQMAPLHLCSGRVKTAGPA